VLHNVRLTDAQTAQVYKNNRHKFSSSVWCFYRLIDLMVGTASCCRRHCVHARSVRFDFSLLCFVCLCSQTVNLSTRGLYHRDLKTDNLVRYNCVACREKNTQFECMSTLIDMLLPTVAVVDWRRENWRFRVTDDTTHNEQPLSLIRSNDRLAMRRWLAATIAPCSAHRTTYRLIFRCRFSIAVTECRL
jgi:hypothetical protein